MSNTDRREMSIMQRLSIPEANDPPWSLLEVGGAVVALVITLILMGPAISSVLLNLEDTTTPTPFVIMFGWTIGEALTILFVVISRRSSQESWQALKLNRGYLPLPFMLMFGVATALTVDLMIGLLSGQFLPIPEIFGFQSEGTAGILMTGLLLIVIQPVAESLVFQGVALPKLRIMFGAWGGVAVTTVIFTALHYAIFYLSYQSSYPDSTMLWYGIAYPLLAGFVFCLIKVYTDSTRAVVIARMGAGAIFLLTALALVSG